MSHNQTPLTTVRSVIIDLAWNFSYITVNSVILVLYYPSNLLGTGKGGRCEGNIVTFLLGQVVLSLLYSLPQKPLQYFLDHYRPEWKRHPVVMTLWMMWSIITLFDIAWFIAGQVWVFRSSECRPNNPPIFWLALSEIIFFYLTTILPLTVYIILVFIARRRQRFLPPEPGTTGPAAHLRGGLSKVELNSLRTFLFKPAVTVQPIEEKSDLESGLGEPLKTAEEEEDADRDSVSEIPLEEGINHISEEEDEKKVNVAAEADVKPMKIATDRHGVQLDQGSGSGTLATSGPINPATSTADSTDVITSPTADLKKPSTSSPSAYPPQILVSPAATDSSPTDAPSETPVAEVEEPLPPGAATNCAICFSDFEPGDRIRELACHHIFHVDCVDPWLIAASEDAVAHRTCPLCVREAILPEFRDPLVEQAMKEAAEEEAMMAGVLAQSRLEAEQARERRDGRRRGGSVGGERQGGGIFLRSRRSRSENPSPQDSSPTSLRSEGYTATSPAGGSPSHLVPPQTVTSPQPQQRGRSFTSVSAIFRRRSSNHSRSSAVQSARNATAPPTSPSAPSLSTLAAPPSIAVVPSTPVPPSPETPSTTSTNNLTLDPTLEVQSTRARLTAMKTRLEQARNRIISPSSTTTTSASDTSSLRLTATALLAIDAALLDVGDAIGMGVLAELEAHVREVEDAVSRASSVQDEGGDERGGVVSLSGSLDEVTEEEGELDEVTVESGNHEKR